MSDFDDLLRNSKTENKDSSDQASDKSSDSKKKSSSSASVAGMFGASDMAELTRKFNLDPEMGERVLVPLVNFLEKYGVADAVDTSPTASRLLNLAEFWNDIAPVVRNASDFFGGRKQTLDDSDKEFLERIRAAQNDSADMTLFQTEDDSTPPSGAGFVSIGESVDTAPAPASEPVELPKDPFTDGPVDWYDLMGEPQPGKQKTHYETSGLNSRIETQFGINGLEQLAKEAGLSIDEVMERDSQNKINRKSSDGVDYTSEGGIPTFQSGVDKIQAQMAAEAENHRRNSKISFEDLPTPESAEQYNPLAVDGLQIPDSLKGGGLESLGSLAAKAGVSEEDLKVQPVGSKEAESQTITQQELSEVHDTPHVTIPENPDRPDSSTFLVDFE